LDKVSIVLPSPLCALYHFAEIAGPTGKAAPTRRIIRPMQGGVSPSPRG
jgi:hypothetical protein